MAWTFFPGAPCPASADTIPVALLTAVRVVQAALGAGMAAAASALALRLTGNSRAALVTAAGLAIGPVFVVEPFRVLTETLFLALLTAALLLYVRAPEQPAAEVPVGIALGLAALTRPVAAALPLALALLLWTSGTGPRRRRALALLLAFGATMAPWSLSLRRQTGSWLPQGLSANLWIGAIDDGRWQGSAALDALRARFPDGPDAYAGEVAARIRATPGAWLGTRARNFLSSLGQPHFAPDVPGSSAKRALSHWWNGDRGLSTLARSLSGTGALLKLALYGWHWLALAAALAGSWRWRRRWRELAPLWAVILYFPAVHLFLTALPRYLFPIQPALWVVAALAVISPGPGGDG